MDMNNHLRKLHDSELVCVLTSRQEKSLRLEFLNEQNVGSVLIATGVKAFRLSDLSLQNVVSRAFVVGGVGADDAWVRQRLLWATSSADASSYLLDGALDNYLLNLQSGELSVLVLEPSAGAEAVILCGGIAFEEARLAESPSG